MKWKWIKRLIVPVLLLVIALDNRFGSGGIVAGPSHALRFCSRQVGHSLERRGVAACWDFDDPVIVESVGQGDHLTDGTELTRGRYGGARRFLREKEGYIASDASPRLAGTRFTITLWLRVPNPAPDQQILNYLAIRKGRLLLTLPPDLATATCDLPADPGFLHIAATVDSDTRQAALYVNGERRATVAFKRFIHTGGVWRFGQRRWAPPPDMTLDDVVVWKRALTPDEIRSLSRAGASVVRRLGGPGQYAGWVARACASAGHTVARAVDLLNPVYHGGRVRDAGLCTWELRLSKADLKAFNAYHNNRLENGLSGAGTSGRRRIGCRVDGTARHADMELIGTSYDAAVPDTRWTFAVDIPGQAGVPEPRRILFEPPEGRPVMAALFASRLAAECGRRGVPTELCLLRINGALQGVYLCRDGVGVEASLEIGGLPHEQAALPIPMPLPHPEVRARWAEMAGTVFPLLVSDPAMPLDSARIRRDLRQERKTLMALFPETDLLSDAQRAARVCAYLSPELLLGRDNPAAGYVIGDLDFSLKALPGATLAYRSSAPGLVSPEGRVQRPAEGASNVAVVATVTCGQSSAQTSLCFRIIPRRTPIPLVWIRTDGVLDPIHRVRCAAALLAPGGGRETWLPGRIRFRGNSALAAEKKYYSLRMDAPHDWLGPGAPRYLSLTSYYKDITLMKEKLSYDLFNAFRGPDRERYAPHSRYVELVVNQDYRGVYGLSERVDAAALGFDESPESNVRTPSLYKAKGERANFSSLVYDAYVQEEPSWRKVVCWESYEELIGFLGQSTPDDFAAHVEQRIDVDNAMDMEILVNLANNREGTRYNMLIARGGHAADRFFLIPWDYDVTYVRDGWLSNHLFSRLHRDLPGYRRRLYERWRELREGPLSEASLVARLDTMERDLAGAAERNFQRWHPRRQGYTHEQGMAELRAWIPLRLAYMDKTIEGFLRAGP